MNKDKDEHIIYWYHELKEYVVDIKNKIAEETVSSIYDTNTGMV